MDTNGMTVWRSRLVALEKTWEMLIDIRRLSMVPKVGNGPLLG